MTMRAIAMVSEHASPLATVGGTDAGGQNVYVAELASALARRGHQVVVHTRRDDPCLPRRVRLAPGVIVEHVDAGPPRQIPKDQLLPFMGAFAAELAAAWSSTRPEVVHSHFWMSGKAALAAATPLGIPVAHTFHALGTVKRRHQGRDDPSPASRIREEAATVARAGRIVATCRDEASELAQLGAAPERVAVVPCGVDLEAFTSDGPAEPRAGEAARLVVLGRLVARKGVDDVVAALAFLPGTELVIAGGPSPESLDDDHEVVRLRQLASAAGVADRVHLRGRVSRDAVPALLRSADVVVHAPWYEPFGIVPLEAMACGVPVVATAVGGLLDTVDDGVTGLHVPPRQPRALAAAIRHLLDNPARRQRLGANGVRRVQRDYGWPRIAEQIEAVYERLLAEAETGARRPRLGEGVARGGPAVSVTPPLPTPAQHLHALRKPLAALEAETGRIEAWGRHLTGVLLAGGRLLAAGNGGSAAQAQHLTAELVGRYRDDRIPLSAIALHADTSSLTAIANDYGAEALFTRQTLAHGRPGDVLVALSTSGRSGNVLAAVRAARDHGLTTWGLTGPARNPLADGCDDAVCIPAPATATVQELHLVVVHLLCAAVDVELARRALPARAAPGTATPAATPGPGTQRPAASWMGAPAQAAPSPNGAGTVGRLR